MAPRHPSYALSSLIILISVRNEGDPPFLLLQSCISTQYADVKEHFSAGGGKGSGLSYETLAKRQNGAVLLLHRESFLDGSILSVWPEKAPVLNRSEGWA